MHFDPPLLHATLVRRYKRFLADVTLPDGTELTVHCPNTGAMLGCDAPGSRVWLSRSDAPHRRYAHTWELVEVDGGVVVGIHSARANALVGEALEDGRLDALAGYAEVRSEVRLADGASRIDFLLQAGPDGRPCVLEVKSVTASTQPGVALFPDAVSKRGARHLEALASAARGGARAVLLYCVQRGDIDAVRPAREIDAGYAAALAKAADAGVEVVAYGARVDPTGIAITRRVEVRAD